MSGRATSGHRGVSGDDCAYSSRGQVGEPSLIAMHHPYRSVDALSRPSGDFALDGPKGPICRII